MPILKRVKAGATHYAARVNPNGHIPELTADRAKACQVTQEQAAAAKAFYSVRPEFGGLAVEHEGKEKVLVAEVAREKPADPEVAKLRRECDELRREKAAAGDELRKLRAENTQLKAAGKDLAGENAELRAQLEQLTAPANPAQPTGAGDGKGEK